MTAMETVSSDYDTVSSSPAVSVNRQVIGRSVGWIRQVGQISSNLVASRYNLRDWNPWTNETATARQKLATTDDLPGVGITTTKAAGSIYEHLLSQERLQQQQQQLNAEASTGDSLEAPVVVRRQRPNSNCSNKNPFSINNKANTGLRDVQKHNSGGKQTTIITQFKAAESNVDGKVDINIIMDSESNISNVGDESSFDATAAGGGGGVGGVGGIGGADENDDDYAIPSFLTEDDSAAMGGEEDDDPLSTAGEDEGGDAEDSDRGDNLPTPGDDKKSDKTEKKKLNMGHLDKEGIVIGCMNVFADVSKKEYIVLLTDRVVEAFLVDPGQFRSIAKRTGCEIEVTRRILNRRIGAYRWVKYLVVTLRGPNMVAIDQCDRLMVKIFPPYKIRKPYTEQSHISLFVKETYPDNSDLYFNFQRTGPTSRKVGDLRLRPPFCKSASRPIESTPWKLSNPRLLSGILEPRNMPVATTIKHVYPEWGTEECSYMDIANKWEQAGDIALEMEKRNGIERSHRVKQRKLCAETLFAGGD